VSKVGGKPKITLVLLAIFPCKNLLSPPQTSLFDMQNHVFGLLNFVQWQFCYTDWVGGAMGVLLWEAMLGFQAHTAHLARS
jgi:hypothetical protein